MPRRRFLAPALVVCLFAIAAAGVIASGRIPHRVAYDQKLYHEEAVRIFAKQWPGVDVGDYLSATTPGFHLVLAAAVKYLHIGTTGMQVVCALIGAALLWLLAGSSSRGAGRSWHAAVIVLPFAASMYVFASGVWVLPDNAAWLGVLAILLMALRPGVSVRSLLVMGIALAGLVLLRQIHLWLAGVIVAAAWLGADEPEEGNGRPLGAVLFEKPMDRVLPVAVAVLACLPAVLILVYFYGRWGGLVPPSFQFQYRAVNPAGPAFILAVIGAVSVFYAGYISPLVVRLVRGHLGWAVLAGAAGLVLGAVPRTTAGDASDFAAGRRTGLWDVAAAIHQKAHVPNLGHCSPVILGLSVLGAVAVAAWLLVWTPRQRVLLLAAIAGYSAAFAAGGELWQRYAEPFALMFVILSALRTTSISAADDTGWVAGTDRGNRFRYRATQVPLGVVAARLAPVLLAGLFAMLTVRDLNKADTGRITDPAPPPETSGPGQPPPRPDSPWSRYMIGHQRHPAFWKP